MFQDDVIRIIVIMILVDLLFDSNQLYNGTNYLQESLPLCTLIAG